LPPAAGFLSRCFFSIARACLRKRASPRTAPHPTSVGQSRVIAHAQPHGALRGPRARTCTPG
jgi:hypothetical protein